MKKIAFLILITIVFSCKEELNIPKPPTYLRLELPEHKYTNYHDDCAYTFSVSDLYNVKPVMIDTEKTCHKDIELGPLNGTIHLSYINMTEPLSSYVNHVNDKIGDHKIKATAINDAIIMIPEHKVYCTFFELEGNVASPFQFYLTDSLNNFASAVVYFNSTPNYDSLRPTLDYLKVDIEHMINNFEWKD